MLGAESSNRIAETGGPINFVPHWEPEIELLCWFTKVRLKFFVLLIIKPFNSFTALTFLLIHVFHFKFLSTKYGNVYQPL